MNAVVGGLAIVLALARPAASAGEAPLPQVTVAHPIEKRITIWDEYWGRFEAVQSIEVRARVSGFIDKVHYKDGQLVEAGALLYTIDPRPFRLAVESAEAEVARTSAQVDLAENEVERARPLLKSAAVTERDFDQRKANLSIARAQRQAAEANLGNARLNLEWTEVRAPIAGRISDSKLDMGNMVVGGNAAQSTVLSTIVSLDPIHFVFDAAEADYLRYSRMRISGERPSSREAGNPVRVKLADEEEFSHEGRMDFVDNQMNARSGTMRGRAILDNPKRVLVPGLFGRLKLFGGESNALLVPDSAIVADQMRKIVYTVAEDGTLKATPVTLGPIEDGLRVIRSGLMATERIVINGLANPFVRAGAKVAAEQGEIKTSAAH
jgi:RND family efflux transporter MFP subunit